MPRLAKWALQVITICAMLFLVMLGGCSSKISDEVARKDFQRLGGTELVVQVDIAHVLDIELNNLKDSTRQEFRSRGRLRTEIIRIDGDELLIRLRDAKDMPKAMDVVKSLDSELSAAPLFSGEALSTSAIGEKQFRLSYTKDYIY